MDTGGGCGAASPHRAAMPRPGPSPHPPTWMLPQKVEQKMVGEMKRLRKVVPPPPGHTCLGLACR